MRRRQLHLLDGVLDGVLTGTTLDAFAFAAVEALSCVSTAGSLMQVAASPSQGAWSFVASYPSSLGHQDLVDLIVEWWFASLG